jgi:hypothetical protein
MKIKDYNHSNKGKIVEIHLHSPSIIKLNPSCKTSNKKNAKIAKISLPSTSVPQFQPITLRGLKILDLSKW